MRQISLVILLAALATAGATAAPSSPRAVAGGGTARFVLTGHGWGHGVGFSQCGALGYAKHGWKYDRILTHYYRGTKVVKAPATRIRALVGDGRASVAVASARPFRVRDGGGEVHTLAAGTAMVTPKLKLKVDDESSARALPGPLTFLPAAAMLSADRKPYRGQLVVKVVGGRLRVVNSLTLDQYVYGVVPLEIGSTGPLEALKAQAVAARSYAVSHKRSGDFDVYPDTRDQVYGGVGAERPGSNSAVDATSNEVLTYAGKVISAYYFASSGGRTAAVQDVWAGRPVPYLVSVSDPYDGVCPQHSWGPYVYTGAALGRKLGASGRVVDARTAVNSSARVSTLSLRTSAGTRSLTGADVRRIMGLRSTWFRFGVLSVTRPPRAAVYGGAAVVTGIARGLAKPQLQARTGTAWASLAAVVPAADGSFAVRVKLKRSTDVRVAAGKAASGAVRLLLAPRVTLQEGDLGELVGTVRPATPGVRVEVQRQNGSSWARVSATRTDAGGRFVASPNVTTGVFRARALAHAGLAAGTSPPLQVSA